MDSAGLDGLERKYTGDDRDPKRLAGLRRRAEAIAFLKLSKMAGEGVVDETARNVRSFTPLVRIREFGPGLAIFARIETIREVGSLKTKSFGIEFRVGTYDHDQASDLDLRTGELEDIDGEKVYVGMPEPELETDPSIGAVDLETSLDKIEGALGWPPVDVSELKHVADTDPS